MYIEITDFEKTKSFNNVEEVTFHSQNGDTKYNDTFCIHHKEKYTAFTLLHDGIESSFSNKYVITKVIQ